MYLIGHLYNSLGREKTEREEASPKFDYVILEWSQREFFRRKIKCRLFSSIVSYLLLNMTSNCELCPEMKMETIEEQEYVLNPSP
jgi:hypothetical protein